MQPLTEKGTLPIGVEYECKVHKEFVIREQLVRDSISVFDIPERSKRATINAQYAAVCILAEQIVSLGTIPREAIDAGMILDMTDADFRELRAADERLEKQRKSFHDKEPPASKDSDNAPKDGVSISGDNGVIGN